MAPLQDHVTPMLLVDPQNGRIRRLNAAAIVLYGRDAATLGQMSIDGLDTQAASAVLRFRQKAASVGCTMDTRHRLASGATLAVRLSASPVRCAAQPYLLCIVQDMTELEQMHSDLRVRQDQLNLVLGTAVAGYTEVDYETGNVFVSGGMLALMGYSADLPLRPTATLDALVHPDDVGQVREISRSARNADHVVEYRFRLHHRVDTWVWVQAGGTMRYDIAGHPVRFVGTLHDINFAMRIEANLRGSEARYRLMFDASPLPMLVLDQSGERILEANKAAQALYGFVQTSLAGRPARTILGFGQMALFRRLLATPSSDGIASIPMKHQTLDGRVLEVECHCSPLVERDRRQSLVLVHDLTERKAAEAVIQRLITLDTLTQLPNRELVLRRLGQSIAYCRRHRKVGVLLLIDLDSFRTVNTAVGREFGDALLREVARRLGHATRASDMVARLAGDEFAIVLDQQETSGEAASRAAEAATRRVLDSLRQPYQIDGADLFITASIGVVLLDGSSGDGNQVITHAEAAVSIAKEAGRNTMRFYDPNQQTIRDRRVSLEMDLRRALDDEQFRLFYQVQVDQHGRPRGAEVLLRWMHPSRGMVPPLEFVHPAEETGVIHSLGRWVLQRESLPQAGAK
ncbi:MAG: diguanylate cyclase [Burkholderiaceae bacterium]